ncbi:hypothetical protein TDIS_0807 [Thermosulfurimonas dismutans]|uniref:Uncharacterized protein n=1 Tax=Thermosulfurimonas dismutans TaxID=999894 RepID=A0A179D4Z6_9BACT|nr:hypothetical protein TDIS_0807 [Thermosulfurimonas dismutans]
MKRRKRRTNAQAKTPGIIPGFDLRDLFRLLLGKSVLDLREGLETL